MSPDYNDVTGLMKVLDQFIIRNCELDVDQNGQHIVLGTGGSSLYVKRGSYTDDNGMKHSVAIKKGMRPNEMMKEFINMKAIERGMARDNSPRLKNIAKACGFNDAKNELYLELIQGMKLVQFVESVENLSMDDKIRLMNVVVDTLEDIHEAGYTHGDVHDRNIIMQYDPPGSGEASDDFENTVQLIDFGHSEADTTPREIWDQWNYFFLNLFDVEYIVDDLPSGLTREMVSDWKRRFMNDQD